MEESVENWYEVDYPDPLCRLYHKQKGIGSKFSKLCKTKGSYTLYIEKTKSKTEKKNKVSAICDK